MSWWALKKKATPQLPTDRPCGVWNTGQSCHLGASIVALSASLSLRNWLNSQTYPEANVAALLKKYLLTAASSPRREALDPRPILHTLTASGWKARHAQDAHDTTCRLLELLQGNVVNKVVRTSGLSELRTVDRCVSQCVATARMCVSSATREPTAPFSMITSSEKQCCACGSRGETRFERCDVAVLPALQNVSLLDRLFMETFMTEEEVEMTCEKCHAYGKHRRKLDVWRLPEVLIIYLPRAAYLTGVTGKKSKVVFRRAMNTAEGVYRAKEGRFRSYRLRAVIRHYGAAAGYSHFTSIVRHIGNSKRENADREGVSWWTVDDDRIYTTDEAEACDGQNAFMLVLDLLPN